MKTLICILITCVSCASWSNVTPCATYSYTYRCLEDNSVGVTIGAMKFVVGEKFTSPKSGHKCVIVKEILQ